MFNFFKNQKQAERQRNCLKFTNQLRKYVEENDIDEAIEGQRYFIYFDETQGEIVVDWLQSCVIQGTIFANSKEVLLDAIKFLGEENVKQYIFGKQRWVMKYIASCSFGKDSLAMLLKILELGLPLDEVVYCDIRFDEKSLSGETQIGRAHV